MHRRLLRFSLPALCILVAACKMQACSRSPTEPESEYLGLVPLHKCPTGTALPLIFDVEIELDWECHDSMGRWAGAAQSQDCQVIFGQGRDPVNCNRKVEPAPDSHFDWTKDGGHVNLAKYGPAKPRDLLSRS